MFWDELFIAFQLPIYWFITLLYSAFLFTKNIKRRDKFLLRTIGGIVLIIILQTFVCFGTLKLGELTPNVPLLNAVYQTIFFVFVVIAVSALLIFTYDINLKETIFLTVAAYSIEHMSNGINAMLVYFIELGGLKIDSIYLNIFFNIGFKILLITLFYFLFVRKYYNDYEVKDIINNKILGVSFVNLVFCLVLSIFKGYAIGGEINKFTTNIICNIYAIFGCFLCLYMQFSCFIEIKLKNDNHTLDVLIKEQNKLNQSSKENMELLNIKFHDIKKQLTRLEDNINLNNDAHAKEEINNIKKTLSLYDAFVKTGNAGLDSILLNCYLASSKNNIDFTYFVDGQVLDFIATEDVVSLFDNLVNNALEASLKEAENNRIIHLQCYKEKEIVFIHFRNYCSIKPDFYKGLPITKKDRRFHGYGMKSIVKIVEKYNGEIKCTWKNHYFNVTIMIPINN